MLVVFVAVLMDNLFIYHDATIQHSPYFSSPSQEEPGDLTLLSLTMLSTKSPLLLLLRLELPLVVLALLLGF